MSAERLVTRAGPLEVRLPDGEVLQDVHGIAYWSPDPRLGRFMVEEVEDADAVLAAQRSAGALLTVEDDEDAERGGLPVRRLRYRTTRHAPRVHVADPGGGRHEEGGRDEETLSEVLVIGRPGGAVRAGYAVLTDAPDDVRAALAGVLEGLRIGDEA